MDSSCLSGTSPSSTPGSPAGGNYPTGTGRWVPLLYISFFWQENAYVCASLAGPLAAPTILRTMSVLLSALLLALSSSSSPSSSFFGSSENVKPTSVVQKKDQWTSCTRTKMGKGPQGLSEEA